MRDFDRPLNIHRAVFTRTDFIYWGHLILEKAQVLSQSINRELLKPIAAWLKDPDWLQKLSGNEIYNYNWANYKKQSRYRSRIEQHLKESRSKKFRREYQKNVLHSNKQLKPHLPHSTPRTIVSPSVFFEICKPFSPLAINDRHCQIEFARVSKLPLSLSIPWGNIIASDLSESERMVFTDLANYCPANLKRQETVAKFRALLDMENQNEISLHQKKHSDKITIENHNSQPLLVLSIKERHGDLCENLDWQELSKPQKRYVIKDVLAQKIIIPR